MPNRVLVPARVLVPNYVPARVLVPIYVPARVPGCKGRPDLTSLERRAVRRWSCALMPIADRQLLSADA